MEKYSNGFVPIISFPSLLLSIESFIDSYVIRTLHFGSRIRVRSLMLRHCYGTYTYFIRVQVA